MVTLAFAFKEIGYRDICDKYPEWLYQMSKPKFSMPKESLISLVAQSYYPDICATIDAENTSIIISEEEYFTDIDFTNKDGGYLELILTMYIVLHNTFKYIDNNLENIDEYHKIIKTYNFVVTNISGCRHVIDEKMAESILINAVDYLLGKTEKLTLFGK